MIRKFRFLLGWKAGKPVLMIIGGSLGSAAVNTAVRNILPDLLKDFQIIHLVEKENWIPLTDTEGYVASMSILKMNFQISSLCLILVILPSHAICEISAFKETKSADSSSANASRVTRF